MLLRAQAHRASGPRPWVHALLPAAMLALLFAGICLLVLPSSRLETPVRRALMAGAGQQAGAQRAASPLPPGLDLTAGTPVHGRLAKRGPFQALAEMAAGRRSAELTYGPEWAAQRLAGAHTPLPSKWCAVMFNDRYKVIYLKCPKTGGNTLVRLGAGGQGERWAGALGAPAGGAAMGDMRRPHSYSHCLLWRLHATALCDTLASPPPADPAGQPLWDVPAGAQGILPEVPRHEECNRSPAPGPRVAGAGAQAAAAMPVAAAEQQHGALQALHMARPCQAAGACLQRPRCICSSRLLLPRPSQPPQDYFVFGFSRNILARAISQYRYLTHFMAACRLVSWGDFCRDPFVLGDVCKRGEPAGRPCCTQSPVHQYVHVLPQAHCFTTARNESVSPGLLRSLPAVHGDDQCSS